MERRDVNPWEWSKGFGFSQAVELKGAETVLFCSGQTAMDADGGTPTTLDMAKQIEIATGNLDAVLTAAGMDWSNIVKLTVYTTDVDAFLAGYAMASELLAPNQPAMTLIGVARLAFPELMVEIEATAAR